MAKISVPATLRRAAWLTLPSCCVALSALSGVAHAQLGDMMKSAPTGAIGDISGMSMSSLTAGSAGNAAGVIEYCMKNNYLNADSATSAVKDKLLGSVPGGTKDAGYSDGSRGVLSTSNGRQLDLSNTAAMKAEVKKQVCDKILAQGKSML
jgi:hypothetical protein